LHASIKNSKAKSESDWQQMSIWHDMMRGFVAGDESFVVESNVRRFQAYMTINLWQGLPLLTSLFIIKMRS
jgi:hypothetical protein